MLHGTGASTAEGFLRLKASHSLQHFFCVIPILHEQMQECLGRRIKSSNHVQHALDKQAQTCHVLAIAVAARFAIWVEQLRSSACRNCHSLRIFAGARLASPAVLISIVLVATTRL